MYYDHYKGRYPYFSIRWVGITSVDGLIEAGAWPMNVIAPDLDNLGSVNTKAEYMALWNADQAGKHKLTGWHAPFGFFMISYVAPAFTSVWGEFAEGGGTWITEEPELDPIVTEGTDNNIINQ